MDMFGGSFGSMIAPDAQSVRPLSLGTITVVKYRSPIDAIASFYALCAP
jgi:hypothetical protein